MREYRLFEDYLVEQLRDRNRAQLYLDIALEDLEEEGNTADFLLALRRIVQAQGGMSKLSREAELNRANLYAALSENGNPRLETIMAILKTLGMRLSVKQIEKAHDAEAAKAEVG